MSMEAEEIFFADQNLATEQQDQFNQNEVLKKFKHFLREWTVENEFIYREQLINNSALDKPNITINLGDVENFDLRLSCELRAKPLIHVPILERAAQELYGSFDINKDKNDLPEFQVNIKSNEHPKALRSLKSDHIGKLINVNGIIVNAGKMQLRGKMIKLRCKNCGHEKNVTIECGMGGFASPFFCERGQSGTNRDACPRDPYAVIVEQSEFTDFQVLKIQEAPDIIPTGEIPRTYQICVDGYLVDMMVPGTRVTVTGIYSILERKSIKHTGHVNQLKLPYITVLGVQTEQTGARKIIPNFDAAQVERFMHYSKDPNIYQRISNSIGTGIYGHECIKNALACLLFGGAAKVLPDSMKLRGDINILLLGDPSTAKSQFLKFMQKVAPISVYTSGKGSSAAGLTAAIIRDPSSKEFQLEVLADGGIVCIDEFDKMRSQDRVAIHEAMEQQTISIAKAGITTILNARTSVLAAANPIFGRYDDFKQISDQIDLQTTILSRFDCIFIVRDVKSKDYDRKIAAHIINLHQKCNTMAEEHTDIDLDELRNYVAYARMNCSPRLDEESAIILQNLYVEDRQRVKEAKQNKIRQLEATIRLAESMAKMRLSNNVNKADVEEAHRLFNISTMNAIKSGVASGYEITADKSDLVFKIEDAIKRKVSVGNRISHQRLQEDLEAKYPNARAIEMAIFNMIKKEEMVQVEGSRFLLRKR